MEIHNPEAYTRVPGVLRHARHFLFQCTTERISVAMEQLRMRGSLGSCRHPERHDPVMIPSFRAPSPLVLRYHDVDENGRRKGCSLPHTRFAFVLSRDWDSQPFVSGT